MKQPTLLERAKANMNAVIRRRINLRLGFLLFDTQLILGNDSLSWSLIVLLAGSAYQGRRV